MPKVSVLLAVYNTKSEYLHETINSVLNQTFTDFELVIVNDGSTEKHVDDIICSYQNQDKRIRYYVNDINVGISKTRNRLIDLSYGEYLAVHDHDDISLPDRLECQVAYLDSHPEVGVVGSHYKEYYSGKIRKLSCNDADIKVKLAYTCEVLHPSAVIRKSILEKHHIRYVEFFSPAEDYYLWCQLIPYTRFHNINKVLVSYRKHTTNTSKLQRHKIAALAVGIRKLVEIHHPELHAIFSFRVEKQYYLRLFMFIPLISIHKKRGVWTVKLFNFIPILLLKHKTRKRRDE
jgi:glycosyltransferase involved in cell wall biosynthesis